MTLAQRLDPLLEIVLPAVRRAEQFLGPEDDWVEDDRRILYEVAQRHLGHLHTFTKEKGTAEYVTTVKEHPDVVETLLMPPYQRNVLSNRKYRTYHGGGKQWSCISLVIDPIDEDWQHHVYGFKTEDGYTDLHSHTETSVREGAEHLTERQNDATAHVLFDIFDRNGVEYEQRY